MTSTPLSSSGKRKLTALRFDGPSGARAKDNLDRYVRMAQHSFDVPVVAISVFEDSAELLVSSCGLDFGEAWRGVSWREQGTPREVSEAATIERFNPFFEVSEICSCWRVSFFLADREIEGTLRIFDTKRGPLGASERALLEDFGHLVEDELLRLAELEEAQAEQTNRDDVELVLDDRKTWVPAIIEELPDGIVACDAEGNLIFFNRTLRNWHGCDVRSVRPQDWAKRFDLFDSDGVTHLGVHQVPLVRALSGERVRDQKFYIVAKGQAPRYINAHADRLLNDRGETIGAFAIMHDISDRTKTEREVTQAIAMLDATEDGIFICDSETLQFVYVNRGAIRQVGYSREELLAMTPLEIKPEYDESAYRATLQVVKESPGQLLRFETLHRHKQGYDVPVELNFQLVTPPGGRENIVVTARDISERVKAETMRVAKEASDEANRAKSAFLAKMSHEIRTPMNAILGYAQLMKNEAHLPPRASNYLEIIGHSSEHLLGLINEILDMSKVEAGTVDMRFEVFNLLQLLRDIEAMFRLSAQDQGLSLHLEILEDLPTLVESDKSKIRQVLINLVANAVKYTVQGGIVVRACGHSGIGGAAQVVIDVVDSGEGIDDAEHEAIFAPFEQAKRGRAEAEGTGLGLTISRRFAEALEGKLELHASSTQGSVFRFSFPVGLPDAEALAAAAAESPDKILHLADGIAACRILVADDRETNRDLLCRLLERVGFTTMAVSNGEEAVAAAKSWSPHLILMDMRMPEMDGQMATRAIRETVETADIPVVIVSASAMEENRAEAFEAGANGFIRKPFRENEILEEIARLLTLEYIYESVVSEESGEVCGLRELRVTLGETLRPDQRAHCRELLALGDVDELIGYVTTGLDALDEETVGNLLNFAENLEFEALERLLAE